MPEAGWTSITGSRDQVQAISELVAERDRLRALVGELAEALQEGIAGARHVSDTLLMSGFERDAITLSRAARIMVAALAKTREA